MKQIGLEEKKLLQEYISCSTMNSDVLESIVNDMKKDKVLKAPIPDNTTHKGRWTIYDVYP